MLQKGWKEHSVYNSEFRQTDELKIGRFSATMNAKTGPKICVIVSKADANLWLDVKFRL